jgi:hypothetical protein
MQVWGRVGKCGRVCVTGSATLHLLHPRSSEPPVTNLLLPLGLQHCGVVFLGGGQGPRDGCPMQSVGQDGCLRRTWITPLRETHACNLWAKADRFLSPDTMQSLRMWEEEGSASPSPSLSPAAPSPGGDSPITHDFCRFL